MGHFHKYESYIHKFELVIKQRCEGMVHLRHFELTSTFLHGVSIVMQDSKFKKQTVYFNLK